MESVKNGKKEIVIFEGSLGLVQMTSKGEHIIKCIVSRGFVNIIQSNLLETNEFIIHSNLEVLNNIFSLDESFQNNVLQVSDL